MKLEIGVKSDPIEYRYSYDWLFRIMADEGVRHLQLGTFFEIYHLPDKTFTDLRKRAEDYGIEISSIFTAHRELGGFFRGDVAWEQVAYRNFARLIEIGGILGVDSVGSNPGAVMRDEMDMKQSAVACYVKNMKKLMEHAKNCGVNCLAMEPMSCLAEPPTLPEEITGLCNELLQYHRQKPRETSMVGCCADVSHGYTDAAGKLLYDNMTLLRTALPYITEVHLKNTDAMFYSTFGFCKDEREKGIVDPATVRDLLLENAPQLPVEKLVGYLEIGGPKLGRDYSDPQLERQLRESLAHLKEHFVSEEVVEFK